MDAVPNFSGGSGWRTLPLLCLNDCTEQTQVANGGIRGGGGARVNHFSVSTLSRTHEIETMNKTSNDVESMGHSATGENELK